MKKQRYMFAGRILEGIEEPHEVMSYGSCIWCNDKDIKTNIAILTLSYRICKECLKKLEVENEI